jgi:peroxiredoxin
MMPLLVQFQVFDALRLDRVFFSFFVTQNLGFEDTQAAGGALALSLLEEVFVCDCAVLGVPPVRGVGAPDPRSYAARMKQRTIASALIVGLLALGCQNKEPASKAPAAEKPATVAPAALASQAPAASAAPAPAASGSAAAAPALPGVKVGDVAPDFTLADLDGKPVSLASFKGKVVVLEWFNPECPFVKLGHTKGSLIDTAARHAKTGVVWLAINSGGPGKQGHGLELNREGKAKFKMDHPILTDADGKVGRAYGAERTPHMFVIDSAGKLAYRGAIDNSPDGERNAPAGGTLINYIDDAIMALQSGRPVTTPETPPYGCRVKYGDS